MKFSVAFLTTLLFLLAGLAWGQDPQVYPVTLSNQFTTIAVPAESAPVLGGSIAGKVTGAARSTASMFRLNLYGPDDPYRLAGQVNLGADRGFMLEGLPDGKYWVAVSSPVPTPVSASLSQEELILKAGVRLLVDVELR